MRCQYVSGLLLQCKNHLPPSASVTPPSTNQNAPATDNTTAFCEKHQAFVDNVKTHANVLRSAIDPGYKPLPHLSASDPISLSAKRSIPSHVFEPCCSVSTAFSEDNPLRNAGYMTDKEIVQQYNAALGRMINKVSDMRFIIHSRYMEHLKKKAAVKEERKKYKLVVKNAEERACLERLKLDMSYARHNRAAATFLQKSFRKYKAEQKELHGRENIKTWLETPGFLNGDMLCEHEDQVDQSKLTANYVSPKVKNESDPEECARGVMSSLLNAVEEQVAVNTGKKRCSGRRLPMTDFCAKHLKLDPAVQLLDRCKECQAPCLGLDNKLCNLHAKKLFIPLPLQASQIPTASTQTISQRLAVKNTPRLAPLSASQWNMNSRQLPHQMMTRESPGFSTISSIRKPEHYDIRSLSGPLVIKSRRPRDTMQRILQGERQPNETMITEQSKLKIESSDNHQVWTIDEDLSIGELQKQCEQRAILDSTPTAPLQHQPKTKRSMLRINGSNGNGVVIRGPIAIIQHPGVGSFNSNIPIIANRNGKGINPNGLNGLNGFGCARVRVFERSNRKVFLS